MTVPAIVDEIRMLFEDSGASMYAGEPVTQTEHALQAAELGRQAGVSDALVAAALLHDIGHLLHGLGEDIALEGVDDEHERRGAEWLARSFPPVVSQPVLLHVMAKRYRCAVDADYRDQLSAASRLSLQLQGGPLDHEQASRYRASPFYEDSLLLRSWDEAAKVPGEETESLDFFLQYVSRVALQDSVSRDGAG
jgi:phosphonate degradation associated HDIG domain protein